MFKFSIRQLDFLSDSSTEDLASFPTRNADSEAVDNRPRAAPDWLEAVETAPLLRSTALNAQTLRINLRLKKQKRDPR